MSGANTVAPSKGGHIWWIGGGAIALIILGFTWNGLTRENEAVKNSYAQVQNVVQRQADLIPNIVRSVAGYSTHEKSTFVETAQARADTARNAAHIDPEKLANDKELQKRAYEAQMAMMASAQSLINAVHESNPNLQAGDQFILLEKELEGSQNRITVERRRNQDMVREFNTMVQMFPRVFLARLMGFRPLPYFEATTQETPVVDFGK